MRRGVQGYLIKELGLLVLGGRVTGDNLMNVKVIFADKQSK